MKSNPSYNIVIGYFSQSSFLPELTTLGIPTIELENISSLSQLFQNDFYHIVHFYGSKKVFQALKQYVPHYTQLVETVFNDLPKGDNTSSFDQRGNTKTIFVNQELKDIWGVSGDVIPYGIDTDLLPREDRNFLRAKHNIGNETKAIGIVPKASEDINVNFLIQIAQLFQRKVVSFKLVLFYDGPVKSILINKISSLKLDSYICFADPRKVALGFVDIYLDTSFDNELRTYTMQASCYKIPFVARSTPENNRFIQAGSSGMLYDQDNIEALYNRLTIASRTNRADIKLPESYHTSLTVSKISEVYEKEVTQVVVVKPEESKEVTYCIIPYSIYGGAEVYLENHIKKGTFTNVHLVFMSPGNQLLENTKGKVPSTLISTGIPGLGNFFVTNKVKRALFYNSANISRFLSKLKGTLGLNITEIIHSYHQWSDSMHGVDRSFVDKEVVVAATIAKQWSIAKYEVIPPCIDDLKFKIPKAPHKGIVIGTVARFSAEKDLKRVVDIASYLDDNYKFVIVGKDGGTKRDVQNYINEKKLNNRVIIKDHNNEIEKEYAQFDAFLLTSKVEGTPLTILEALAADLPVFAPDIGAIREMLEGKDSYIFFPTEDNQLIADKIRERMSGVNELNSLVSSSKNLDVLSPPSIKKTIIVLQTDTMGLRAIKTGFILSKYFNVIGVCQKSPTTFFNGWGDSYFPIIANQNLESTFRKLLATTKISAVYYHNPGEYTIIALFRTIPQLQKIPLIYDVNDCLSLNVSYAPTTHHLNQKVKEALISHESSLLKLATKIVSPSLQLSTYLNSISPTTILTFPNYFCDFGIGVNFNQKFSQKDNKIHVAYSGGLTFIHKRSVYYLYDIIKKLLENPEVVLHIYCISAEDLKEYKKLDNTRVIIEPKDSPTSTINKMSQCDAAFCIFNPAMWYNPLCITILPNKMFDYISAGLPILAHNSTPNITDFLQKNNVGWALSGEVLDFSELTKENIKIKADNISSTVLKEMNMSNYSDMLYGFLKEF